jgi:predicted phosphoadenosine phosphosulfate sulfurtransferase
MKQKILRYVRQWERKCYSTGIPQEAPRRLESSGRVPSYRLICMAILKNDIALTTLGMSRQNCDAYMALKKIEIQGRDRERI